MTSPYTKKGLEIDTQTKRGKSQKTEAEIGVMHLQAKERQELPGATMG